MEKPKVLIIEDSKKVQEEYSSGLRDSVLIISAFTVEEGECLFARHPDVALIVMDACVPGDNPNTLNLTRKIRESFSGPMIAASNGVRFSCMLENAGCDHKTLKGGVVKKVKELLKL